jgi:hypothetical protein
MSKAQLLVEAVVVGEDQLAARCPFCTLPHTWDTGGLEPMGGIIYVRSCCNVRKAFEYDGRRRLLALRLPREEE